jgi:hypothetical protein
VIESPIGMTLTNRLAAAASVVCIWLLTPGCSVPKVAAFAVTVPLTVL